MRLEKAINPLLDDNDLVSFSFVLNNVINERLKVIEHVSTKRQSIICLDVM